MATGAFTHLSSGGAENAVAGRGGRLPEWRREKEVVVEEKGGDDDERSGSFSSSASGGGSESSGSESRDGRSGSGSGGGGGGSVLEEAEAGVERFLSRAREARDAAAAAGEASPPPRPSPFSSPPPSSSPSSAPPASPWTSGCERDGGDEDEEDIALTAASLLRAALGGSDLQNRNHHKATDWTGYRHRHAQALSDARALRDAVSAAREAAEAEAGALRKRFEKADRAAAAALAEASADADARVAKERLRASEERARADAAAEHAAAALEAAAGEAVQAQAAALARQRASLAREAADTAAEAARRRTAEIDALRLKVAALGLALEKRDQQRASSLSAHRLAASSAALGAAVAAGLPLGDEVSAVERAISSSSSAGGKETSSSATAAAASAVIASLPASALHDKQPTSAALKERWPAVHKAAAELALLPPEGGGVLALALSRVAAAAKIGGSVLKKAADAENSETESENVSRESLLAEASAAVARGDFAAAADAVESAAKGTAGEDAVKGWARDARQKAAAELAARALGAVAAAESVRAADDNSRTGRRATVSSSS